MELDENIRISRLIDTYGVLLTNKQLEIVTCYYFDNLTISEIGDNFGISRQAVNDCINQSVKALDNYEDKLQVVSKLNMIESSLHKIAEESNDNNLTQKIDNIISDLRS